MDQLVHLWERPETSENYVIAGFHQWADAGETSSGLPQYLIELTGARKVGEIANGDFYLFQIPGTHHLLRPEVKLVEGYREEMTRPQNELFYANLGDRGLYIFLGEEPHMQEDRYTDAFFDMVEAVEARRVIALGGVYGAMPYDRDRDVSCVYSLPRMKQELDQYAVRYSNYEGGTTIGSYLAHRAEGRGIELVVLYAFAPSYEFAQLGITLQSMRVEQDFKAWYDIMRRIDYMLSLRLDLADLHDRAEDLIEVWDAKVEELEREKPDLHIRAYLNQVAEDFHERPFIPLDDAWNELGDLFGDMDN